MGHDPHLTNEFLDLPSHELREAVFRYVLELAEIDKMQLFAKDGQMLSADKRPPALQAALGQVSVTQITKNGVKVGERKRTVFVDSRRAFRQLSKALPAKAAASCHDGRAERMQAMELEHLEKEKLAQAENVDRLDKLQAIWRQEWEAEQESLK